MTQPNHLLIHPLRRIQRWIQHSTDAEIASTMMGCGCLLILVAAAVWYLI